VFCCFVIFQIFLVLIFIVAVIMYRVVVTMLMFENKDFRSRASMIASMSAAVVNLLLIMAVGRVYEKLALRLTQWGRSISF
jgi:NADH:ubiquinone oxidoreductase subunit 6 (subunit J)